MRSWIYTAFFLVVMLAITGGLHGYLYYRLVKTPGLGPAFERAGAWVLGVGAVVMVGGLFAARALPRPVASVISYVSFGWMGLVILAFFITLSSEVVRGGAAALGAAGLVEPERRTFLARLLAGATGVLAVGLGGVGAWSAHAGVIVERLRVPLARFPAALDGFKLVQISDVHVGPTIGRDFLQGVVDQINALEPDVVAITGDLVDGTVEQLREHVAPLAAIRAKHGVFFVTGNHEYYSGADAWIAELERLGIRVLRNERVSVGIEGASFDLAGVDDYRADVYGTRARSRPRSRRRRARHVARVGAARAPAQAGLRGGGARRRTAAVRAHPRRADLALGLLRAPRPDLPRGARAAARYADLHEPRDRLLGAPDSRRRGAGDLAARAPPGLNRGGRPEGSPSSAKRVGRARHGEIGLDEPRRPMACFSRVLATPLEPPL
jgi:uncharacterized protein